MSAGVPRGRPATTTAGEDAILETLIELARVIARIEDEAGQRRRSIRVVGRKEGRAA